MNNEENTTQKNTTVSRLLELIDNRIKLLFDALSKKFLSVRTGTVVTYDPDTYNTIVYLDDDASETYTLYNKSGEVLSEGDTVKIYYTTNVAKGWIGARMGEPNYPKIEPKAETEVVITPNQAKYMLKDFEVIDIIDGDIHCYGAPKNTIICSGIRIPYNVGIGNLDITYTQYANYDLSGIWADRSTFLGYTNVECKCDSISTTGTSVTLSYYLFVNGVRQTSSSISSTFSSVSQANHISGVVIAYNRINPAYEADNYGYITFNTYAYRNLINVGGSWTNVTIFNGNTPMDKLYFKSAAERDAAMALVRNSTDP